LKQNTTPRWSTGYRVIRISGCQQIRWPGSLVAPLLYTQQVSNARK